VDHLEIPPIANTSMKMNMMGIPGYIGIPQWMGIIPGMTWFASTLMKAKMKALGVPTAREYLEMLSDAGAKMYACKMSVDMFKLKQEDFLPCVESIVTAGDFMDMTDGAQIVFI
jgi:peroxiredoxin family protein